MLAGAGALAAVSFTGGWKVRDADYQRHLRLDLKQVAAHEAAMRELEGRLEAQAEEARAEIEAAEAKTRVVYRTVTKEVPVYVTQTKFEERVVASGGLPAGFVWLHNNSAANSTAPFPSGLGPDTPTGLGMSDLAGTIAGNYALCYSYKAEAEGWRSWYDRLVKEWPSYVSR